MTRYIAASPMGRNVVVIGMHRSGTSAMTNAIRLLGCSIGDTGDFSSPKKWNPEGNWEHVRLIERNELILNLHGGTWFAPPRLPSGWMQRRKARAMLSCLRSEFAMTYPEEGWVWKDPRACLTLPAWLQAWESAPVAVMAFRHPMAVARSLAARNKFSLRHGLALWEIYNAQALWNLRELPTIVHGYEAALEDPPRLAGALSEELTRHGVELDGSASAAAEALKPSLRRNAAGEDELGSLSGGQRDLWELLNALAAGETWPDDADLEKLTRPSLATRLVLFSKIPLRRRAALTRARLRPRLDRAWQK
jgi:hypothetical protein